MSDETKRPRPTGRRPEGRSGRVLVRMPNELHGQLAAKARAENCSLNSLCVALLTAASGWLREEAALPGG
jgi:predicted HicB family RNase H-like nuclease